MGELGRALGQEAAAYQAQVLIVVVDDLDDVVPGAHCCSGKLLLLSPASETWPPTNRPLCQRGLLGRKPWPRSCQFKVHALSLQVGSPTFTSGRHL